MSHSVHAHQPHPDHDRPSVHGMVVLGRQTIYLSHLPMFHSPHDYQVILEVALPPAAQAQYVADCQTSGEILYTFAPEKFTLPDLAYPDPHHPQRTQIVADIYRGHFERGGVPIIEKLTVEVKHVIHFRKFEPQTDPELPCLEYFFFGSPQELFVAHFITRPPDFDHLLAAQVVGSPFSPEALQAGIAITFPDRPNTIAQRLAGHTRLTGQVQGAPLEIQLLDDIYFETGDLAG